MDLKIETYLTGAFRDLNAFSIPGLGTFHKAYKEASFDETHLQFLPPSMEIVFKQHSNEGLDLSNYLTSYLQIHHLEARQIVSDIHLIILSSLEENGYFEIPAVGTLHKTANHNLEFLMFSASENALADEYFGLEPVRFSRKSELMLQQSDNPTYMNNPNNPEKSLNFSSVGWKTFLLVALIFTLGFLIVDQGPFVIHRSSLGKDMLQVRNVEPTRVNGDFMAINRTPVEENAVNKSEEPEDSELLDGNQRQTEDRSLNAGDTPEPVIVDDPRVARKAKSEESFDESQMATRGGSGSETQRLANPVDKPVNLSVLDTANDDQNTSNQTARLMPQTINYHLIAASFNTLQSAQNYIDNLSEGSLDAIILLPPEGSSQTYRISIYRSKDKNKVESFKTKLEKLGRKSGWIYKELNVK
ncbi:MAG: hypothetical protein KDD99_07235 [Bacteroidetes bacterium]|nr:hypothetical protein [Bacteroidota bacterium]